MKKYAFFCVAVILLLASCKKDRFSSILATKNLSSTFFTLATDSGYILQTPKRAIIKIDPNSFDVPQNTHIKIEIKEVYSTTDILLAGLSTTSNGNLLSSGGMLYFNATVNDQNVNIIKPIHVFVPTKTYDSSMQVFKGEVQKDSTINWVDPQPLDTPTVSTKPVNSIAVVADSINEDGAVENNDTSFCGNDTVYYDKPDTSMTILQSTDTMPTFTTDTKSIVKIENGYENIQPQPASLYEFSINRSGWYNLDYYYYNSDGTTNVKLIASVNMQDDHAMEVYLCIPQRNLLTAAYYQNDTNYIFDEGDNNVDGFIPLVLGDDAILFAVGSYRDKIYYGISKFKVQAEQTISINVEQSSEDSILSAIKDNQLSGIPLNLKQREMEIIQKPCDPNGYYPAMQRRWK